MVASYNAEAFTKIGKLKGIGKTCKNFFTRSAFIKKFYPVFKSIAVCCTAKESVIHVVYIFKVCSLFTLKFRTKNKSISNRAASCLLINQVLSPAIKTNIIWFTAETDSVKSGNKRADAFFIDIVILLRIFDIYVVNHTRVS